MSYKLSGINPLAYIGVEPSQPPQMLIEPRSPTINDRTYNLGTYWLVASPPPTTNWELWILVDLTAGIATWIQLFPGGGGGAVQFDEDVGIAVPALGIVQVKGGENINTVGDNLNKITINLNESIHLPDTSSDGSQGVLFLGAVGGVGGFTFLHNYGQFNTFLGETAGNLTLDVATSLGNTGIGSDSLASLTIGAQLNTAIGTDSLSAATTAANNFAGGAGSLQFLTTGTNNICLGSASGSNYTGGESENILFGNAGVLGESNTIRIGLDPDQTAAYMAGVYQKPVGPTFETVIVDNTGKLGSMTNAIPGGVIITTFDANGTWTKNADSKIVEFYIWGGGAGGGSGRQGASTAAGGGGGGSGGNFTHYKILAAFCGASEAIIIGAGGNGAPGQAGVNTGGTNGSVGGASGIASILFYTQSAAGSPAYAITPAGFGGGPTNSGPTSSNGAGGSFSVVSDSESIPTLGSRGGSGSTQTPGGIQTSLQGNYNGPYTIQLGLTVPQPANLYLSAYFTPGSGGGGGGGDSVIPRSGGDGTSFTSPDGSSTIIYAGALGGAPDTDGANGVAQPTSGCLMIGGGGGSGGGGMNAVRAGNGGNGAVPGGGGAGGGGSLNGTISGAGGNGASGRVMVVEYL